MVLQNALHPKSNVDCLSVPRKESGKGLQGVEGTVNLTNLELENNLKSPESVCLLLRDLWILI